MARVVTSEGCAGEGDTFYLCVCETEAVEVSPWYERGKLEFVGLSLWRVSGGWWGWRARLRYIGHILRYGHPYTDDILLDPSQAADLRDTLSEILKAVKGDTRER